MTGPEQTPGPEPAPRAEPATDAEHAPDHAPATPHVHAPEHEPPPAPATRRAPASASAPAATTPAPPVPPPAIPPPPPPSGDQDGPRPAATPGTPPAPSSLPAPRLDDRERSLDPRMVQVWRVFSALRMAPLLLLGTATGVLTLDRWGWAIGLGLLVLLGVSLIWYQPARYARWRWRLTDLALELRHGVIIHAQETVPYFRIQQIDVIQGPVDRLLGLAALSVTTASASGSVALPGIPASDAPAVRAELLARAAEAVHEHPGEVADAV